MILVWFVVSWLIIGAVLWEWHRRRWLRVHRADVERRTPEVRAWLASVEADAADGSLWNSPSIREQLSDHYKRVGLSD